MRFNDFNKRLQKAGLSPDAMFLISHMFETIREQQKLMDMQTSVMLTLSKAIETQIRVHHGMDQALEKLQRHTGFAPGIHVESVQNDPEDG